VTARSVFLSAALLLALLAGLFGCSRKPVNKAPIQKYKMEGEVIRVDPGYQVAVIKHKDIDGWMKAMTMDYTVRSKEDFSKLHPGDHIFATVFVQGDEFWVGDVRNAP